MSGSLGVDRANLTTPDPATPNRVPVTHPTAPDPTTGTGTPTPAPITHPTDHIPLPDPR
ncbi:hypothetical protein DFQ13_101118 [Actinokineospora spheciospongiae]|nr:hypothetical protein DFQ13_101118 [Actinokineospora spheciospongiae]